MEVLDKTVTALQSCVCKHTNLYQLKKYLDAPKLKPLFIIEILIEDFQVIWMEKIDESISYITIVLYWIKMYVKIER
jgi:hypothetical protein